jgi:hypothetical protein
MDAVKPQYVTLQVDAATKAKLHWVAGIRGRSAHGWLKSLLLAALAEHDDPPMGFGVPRDHDDE